MVATVSYCSGVRALGMVPCPANAAGIPACSANADRVGTRASSAITNVIADEPPIYSPPARPFQRMDRGGIGKSKYTARG